MPRKARVLVPGCPHHVVQRGHNRCAVFVEDKDFQYYLENLIEWKSALNIKIYAWCLMTNHIHLVLEPMNEPMDISVLMKRVNGRQSAYVNRLERRSGSLWEGRYKASPIQRENYLMACLRYVELNPVKAKMVAKPEEYSWSSYGYRFCCDETQYVDFENTFMALGTNANERMKVYEEFVQQGISVSEQQFLEEAYTRNQLTGNRAFIDEIEQRVGLRIEARGRGRPKKNW